MLLQRTAQKNDPWAASNLCHPVRLRLTEQRASFASATEAPEQSQAPVGSLKEQRVEGGIGLIRPQRQTEAIQDALVWAANLCLAFRSLAMAEVYLFELGLESWALRLIRLRAYITERFLVLSVQSNGRACLFTSTGYVHPVVCLLEASLNIQVFRAAVACGCLSEATKLLPFFASPILRTWVTALDRETEGDAGYSNAFGRQARCLSVATLLGVSCLVPLAELLVGLGEQCLLIGEVGLGFTMGSAASRYIAKPLGCNECNARLLARHSVLLAEARLRQGDEEGSLQLMEKMLRRSDITEIEIPEALGVVEALWVRPV